MVQLASPADVDALPRRADEPWLYACAWQDERFGRLRVRSFSTWAGIEEDEAGGAPAVLMGERLRRELTISQGSGL